MFVLFVRIEALYHFIQTSLQQDWNQGKAPVRKGRNKCGHHGHSGGATDEKHQQIQRKINHTKPRNWDWARLSKGERNTTIKKPQ